MHLLPRACGRCVVVFSKRNVSKSFMEGLAKSVELRQDVPEYKHITTFENVTFPLSGEMLLPPMPPEPSLNEDAKEKRHSHNKRMIEVRGYENIHTELLHKQYGLAVVSGGFMTLDHFNFIQERLNKNLKPNQFAIWRADPPWLPKTKRPVGTKMGGGKPAIKEYVTPVRPGRIILEVGGHITEIEARAYLTYFNDRLPFSIEFVSHELLKKRRVMEEKLKIVNKNELGWDTVIKYNMQNCWRWLSPYDIMWKGKYK